MDEPTIWQLQGRLSAERDHSAELEDELRQLRKRNEKLEAGLLDIRAIAYRELEMSEAGYGGSSPVEVCSAIVERATDALSALDKEDE